MNQSGNVRTGFHLYEGFEELQVKCEDLENIYNTMVVSSIKEGQKRRKKDPFQERQECIQKEIDQKMMQWKAQRPVPAKQRLIDSLKEEKELLLSEETRRAIEKLECEKERRARNRS